ncbi:hypothetical protein BKA67DRAFT_646830 [Truncatella angustata]|uniref:Uncharacterized protein n=1 Tax=Truncatella angustata TaxID=152316 RepID=A0A9P8UIK3_9PEZI|nr:uncharacterized protein BKA67DRAFT_646830 [Truncatella angustata]KAH6652807.1 hypothetical protein BKA67DRAFT_646830 [Truncatella angustata]
MDTLSMHHDNKPLELAGHNGFSESPTPLTHLPSEIQLIVIAHLDPASLAITGAVPALFGIQFVSDAFVRVFVPCPQSCPLSTSPLKAPGGIQGLKQSSKYHSGGRMTVLSTRKRHISAAGAYGHYVVIQQQENTRKGFHGRGTRCVIDGFALSAAGGIAAFAVYADYEELKPLYIPAAINFALMWPQLIVVFWPADHTHARKRIKPWFICVVMECIMTVLWISPIIVNTQKFALLVEYTMGYSFPVFSLCVFVANLRVDAISIFRFLNTAGYLLLYLGYDSTDLYLPDISLRRKALYGTRTAVEWWAYSAKWLQIPRPRGDSLLQIAQPHCYVAHAPPKPAPHRQLQANIVYAHVYKHISHQHGYKFAKGPVSMRHLQRAAGMDIVASNKE